MDVELIASLWESIQILEVSHVDSSLRVLKALHRLVDLAHQVSQLFIQSDIHGILLLADMRYEERTLDVVARQLMSLHSSNVNHHHDSDRGYRRGTRLSDVRVGGVHEISSSNESSLDAFEGPARKILVFEEYV